MRELLSMFTETESRDELGIGQVRDAFSDLLFPGTSTLHTRARYLLIVPWCYREAGRQGLRGAGRDARVEQIERRVIGVLKAAGEVDGLIGRVAGVAVKTLPSTIYWGALTQFEIMRAGSSTSFLGSLEEGGASELTERADDGCAATLPPAPVGFPREVRGGLALTGPEAAWLRDRMRLGSPGSMFAHFLQDGHRPAADSRAAWLDEASADAGSGLAADLEHAERFSLVMHGAALLYNLLVGQRYEAAGLTRVEDPVRGYENELELWAEKVTARGGWDRWDRAALWRRVIQQNPRIAANCRVRAFVDGWLDAATSGRVRGVRADRELCVMVRGREQMVKRTQSRFINDKLLRTWSGASGNRQLTFRWIQVRRLLTDIHNGVESQHAPA